MSEIITHKTNNSPDGKALFKGISGNFRNFSQTLFEFTDNSASNFRAHGIAGLIEIILEEHDSYVNAMIRDNGTGIADLHAALTVSQRSCGESTLNEHGMGMKHALASIDAGETQSWSIQTRTREDANQGRYKLAQSPYDIGMPWSSVPGQGDITEETGTVIRFRCPLHKFLTLKPVSRRDAPSFAELAGYLEEELRYTYSSLLRDGAFSILLTAFDKDGKSHNEWITEPLEPLWRDGRLVELPPVETDLGGGPLTIRCRYGSICRNRDNAFYYKGNMASSGAEIRLNGRAIQHGLYPEIWGKALHNTQNRFLAQIDLISDKAGALPATKTAKNAFREDDEKVEALYRWIRTNIPEPPNDETREQILVGRLAEKKEAEPGVLLVCREKPLYRCIGLQITADLFVSETGGVTLYEAKASGSKAENLYQLRMYYDGCVADGMEVREAVLIAHHHPKTVKALLAELNRQKDPMGRPYRFALSTWDQEGIVLPPDAA